MEVEISNVNAAGIDPSKVNSKQRNLHCEQSSLERADGSSLFSQGKDSLFLNQELGLASSVSSVQFYFTYIVVIQKHNYKNKNRKYRFAH